MDEKSITIDLKQEVFVEIGNTFPFGYPTDNMRVLCSILKAYLILNKNLCEMKKDMKILNSVISKIESNTDDIIELNEYIRYGNNKLKEYKGWPKSDLASIGVPR